MTAADLARSATSDAEPPSELSLAQRALWLAKANQWHAAHDLCEEVSDPAGSWIHAYLHRVEGDLGNASYWYHRANRDMPPTSVSLDEEWGQLAAALS